jgi:hypothetical protein
MRISAKSMARFGRRRWAGSGEVDGPFRTKAMGWFGGRRWVMSDEGDGPFRLMSMAA